MTNEYQQANTKKLLSSATIFFATGMLGQYLNITNNDPIKDLAASGVVGTFLACILQDTKYIASTALAYTAGTLAFHFLSALANNDNATAVFSLKS